MIMEETTVKLVETNDIPGGVQLVNTYRTNRVESSDLVALAYEIEKADIATNANVSNKLQVIVEQIRFLKEQARQVLSEGVTNKELNHIACNFVKQPGKIYFLYQRTSGQKYFSMLSPREWGSSCPHEYLGSFRLELDKSWTPEDKFNERTRDLQIMEDLIKPVGIPSLK